MKSMTGFGHGEAQGENYNIIIEMRSVNHRYLEISLRIPKQFTGLEDKLKKLAQTKLQRGKIDIFFTFEQISPQNVDLKLDKNLAIAYHKSMIELAQLLNLPNTLTVEQLATLPGVIMQEKSVDDLDEVGQLAELALNRALDSLIAMRQTEGKSLADDILNRCQIIYLAAEQILRLLPDILAEQQQKMRKRIGEILNQVPVDENKLANEMAYLADKTDVAEELTRLFSHIEQLKEALNSDDVVGRRLDFLLQEMNREVNTIGSKTNSLKVSNIVIELKSELEKIREQVQNIE